jgi:hypothetical protein
MGFSRGARYWGHKVKTTLRGVAEEHRSGSPIFRYPCCDHNDLLNDAAVNDAGLPRRLPAISFLIIDYSQPWWMVQNRNTWSFVWV